MRIGIIQFPGTNCERETRMAVERAGMEAVMFPWNGNRELLCSLDGYVLAGGFSYEDRSRSGIIAALDPIIPIIREAGEQGKPVLGICNGAQVLVESGMVPNLSPEGNAPEAALTTNKRIKDGRVIGTGFYNTWSSLRAEAPTREQNPWYLGTFTSRFSAGECITVPVAHAEGRFMFPEAVSEQLELLGLIPFRYASGDKRASDEFPFNPNGSALQAAAVTNIQGNVMAMMPHPERTEAGDRIFQSMADYLASGMNMTRPRKPLHAVKEAAEMPVYRPESEAEQIVIEQIITDNQAVSVETTLNSLGIPVTVRRRIHWEISFSPGISPEERFETLKKVHESGELYNSNKELPVCPGAPENACTLLVREMEDIEGRKACQALQSWFGCTAVASVTRSVLWSVSAGMDHPLEELVEKVLATHILMNPHSYKRYIYEQS